MRTYLAHVSAGASPEAALGAAQELADDSQPRDEPTSANPRPGRTGAGSG